MPRRFFLPWSYGGEKASLPETQEKGLLTHKLRQLIMDFVRHRDAAKRGGGVNEEERQ